MTYKETARQIYDIIGPANNIINPYHCMTRLRFTVTNEDFTKESLESLEDVKGSTFPVRNGKLSWVPVKLPR